MEPITREEYYLAKIAGTWQGKTPEPVTIEEYYLATMAGDYSGNTPQPVTRLQYYMAKAAGVWGGSIPAPVTRLEYYWAAIANGEGTVFQPVTREEHLLALVADAYSVVITVVTGNPAMLEGVKGSRFTSLTLHGKSSQGSTTGAQLLNTKELITGYYDNSGGIVILDLRLSAPKIHIPTGTTKISISGLADNISALYVVENAEGAVIERNVGYKKQHTISINPESKTIGVSFYNDDNIRITADMLSSCMINFGDIKPYEPYTGGAPSPSPSYPQEIENAGQSGEISVKVGRTEMDKNPQVVIIPTSGGLPGIPVSSGGNYTDEKGQQWVADEIDLARGERVQQTIKVVLDGSQKITLQKHLDFNRFAIGENDFPIPSGYAGFCSHFIVNPSPVTMNTIDGAICVYSTGNIYLRSDRFKSADELKSFLKENPVTLEYCLAEPIRTPLPPETIAAYKALHTYSPTTTVINDAGAGMSVGYKKAK